MTPMPRRPFPHETLYWRRGNSAVLRHGDWKIVRNPGSREFELYDLAKDLAETTNLAASNPDKRLELQRLWEEWNQQNVPPLFEPPRRGRGGMWITPTAGKAPQ